MARFSDVPSDHWGAKALGRTSEAKLVTGYPDGTFRPDPPMSRIETTVVADRIVFGWVDLVEEVDAAMVTVLSPWGRGSGTHIGDGIILTNHHVVAQKIGGSWAIPDKLLFWNSTADPRSSLPMIAEAEAEYVVGSPEYDLAVLRRTNYLNIELPSVPLCSADRIRTGEEIMVVGSPYGLDRTVTWGKVSHPSRRIDYYDDDSRTQAILFQTDAPINPGNSGGAAVNRAGHLLGVPSAGIEGADGLGFAIRIDSVMEFLRAHGVAFTEAHK